jgi:alpha-galactosidase
MTTKISIIGAGSGAFSLSMIRDICLTPNLAGSTVSLMDIDPGRLEGAYAVCRRYADETGFDLKLEKTLDREQSLDGAEFVINTALAAPHEWLREGWEAARRYGFEWGASFHIFYDEPFWVNYYQYRLFESIVEDMLHICPDKPPCCWSPTRAGGHHLPGARYPQAKIVGLCHGFSGVYGVAETLGSTRADLRDSRRQPLRLVHVSITTAGRLPMLTAGSRKRRRPATPPASGLGASNPRPWISTNASAPSPSAIRLTGAARHGRSGITAIR